MKRYSIFIMILLVMIGCGSEEKQPKKIPPKTEKQQIPVRVFKAQQQTVTEQIRTSGSFTSDNETVLGFKIGGIIQDILVEKGDKVQRGQVIAQLDLTEIQAQVTQAETGLQKAERDFQRVEKLYADSVATLEQKQNAKTGLDVAKQQLEIAKFNRSYAQIRAVESGYVLAKLANKGQMVGAGTSILQVGGNVSKQGKWLLTVGVTDSEWAKIQIGDKAEITSEAFKDKKYTAKVTRKARAINPMTSTFDIDIQLIDIPNEIATGLFAEATIYPKTQARLWEVPYEALLDGDKNEAFVFVTTDKKTAQMRKVKVHKMTENKAQISQGLDDNAFIIASGSAYLKNGSSIKIINSK